MAFIGMRHPVAAPITAETEGSAITYGAGMVVGKAISGKLTWDRPDKPLYADDAIAEDDNGVTGGTLEFGADDIDDEARVMMLGLVKENGTGTGATPTYHITDAPAPYVGFGYMRVRRKNGATSYQGLWYHKVQFGETTEEAQTKGESIEWGTPTLSCRVFGVAIDASGAKKYRQHKLFDTEAACKAWLDGLAGIASAGANL